MNNYCYTPSVAQIVMPQTYEPAAWVEFFTWLMQVDHFAPLHALLAHFEFLYELQITVPPTPYRDFYYDLGIEMAVDGETPAEMACVDSGFYGKGIAQLIELTNPESPYFDAYMEVLNIIMHQTDDCVFVEEKSLRMKAVELTGLNSEDCDDQENNDLPAAEDKQGWIGYFESAMANDPCAGASVLSYFLQEANAYEYRVFCPLGDNEYCTVGALMREHEAVLEAAIQTGLMVGAVHTYFGAALDVIENWSMMEGGVRFLLESETLSVFVSGQNRFLAKSLLHAFPNGIEYERDEAQWYEIKRRLRDELSKNSPRGY